MNEKLLYYKGYTGGVRYSRDDGCYYGIVQNIAGLMSYEGKTLEELEEDFHGAVDDYLKYQQNLKEQ